MESRWFRARRAAPLWVLLLGLYALTLPAGTMRQVLTIAVGITIISVVAVAISKKWGVKVARAINAPYTWWIKRRGAILVVAENEIAASKNPSIVELLAATAQLAGVTLLPAVFAAPFALRFVTVTGTDVYHTEVPILALGLTLFFVLASVTVWNAIWLPAHSGVSVLRPGRAPEPLRAAPWVRFVGPFTLVALLLKVAALITGPSIVVQWALVSAYMITGVIVLALVCLTPVLLYYIFTMEGHIESFASTVTRGRWPTVFDASGLLDQHSSHLDEPEHDAESPGVPNDSD